MTRNETVVFHGLSLRQAAVLAGIGLLIVTISAPFAQFFVFPNLVIPGEVEQTIQNVTGSRGLFMAGIFSYLVNYIADIVVTVALYVLLYPVNRALSLLVLLIRVVYIGMSMTALLHYVEVFRLLDPQIAASGLRVEQLTASVYVLLTSYQFDWGFSLFVFGISLLVQGYLVYRASYIPGVLGLLLGVAGVGYIAYETGVYLFPNINLDLLVLTFLAEPIFMVWLLTGGRRIREPEV